MHRLVGSRFGSNYPSLAALPCEEARLNWEHHTNTLKHLFRLDVLLVVGSFYLIVSSHTALAH